MAPPSPRRSFRARAAQSQSQQSSSSSGASGRLDRNTRSHNLPSSGKSTPSASLSSEPLEEFEEAHLMRRRRRTHGDDQDKQAQTETADMVNGSDDLQDEEDEAVRCICGAEDYPGRPSVDGPDAEFFAAIDFTDDVTGFFVQCDICKVWQHGACVGIFSAESSPDEYFCEQCRKDLHKISVASDGQKYSKYQPLHRHSRANSRSTVDAKDGARSPRATSSKGSRGEQASYHSKRRSTMNSRDAAYDDEQLRRAIEASKEDNSYDTVDASMRKGKRGRSDSEETHTNVKRQRTNSRSISPPTEPMAEPSRDDSEDDANTRNGPRNARSHRMTREKSERDERERQRQEAANKRKGRADRRRIEDSDISEEVAVPVSKTPVPKANETMAVSEPSSNVAVVPETPPAAPAATGGAHKRTAKSTQKRGKGKPQFTRERDDNDESPARSMSRDIQRTGEEANAANRPKSPSNELRTTSKAKTVPMSSKMTMLDMKRRVAAIMEFISRTQVDLAAEATFSNVSSSGDASPHHPVINDSGNLPGETSDASKFPGEVNEKDFKDLSCVEMMDVLTRDMVKWQNHYA